MKTSRLVTLFKIFFLSIPCYSLGQTNIALKNGDSVNLKKDTSFPIFIKIAANPRLRGNGIKKLLIGQNYRKLWTQPVEVAVLNLDTAYGGLIPKKLGGGKETKSL